jgi:hypothetical protein
MLSDAAARNAHHIAAHEAKPFPQPLLACAVKRGFEAFAYPKLVRELRDPDPAARARALAAAPELLRAPAQLVQCIAAGVTPALVALLLAPDCPAAAAAAAAAAADAGKGGAGACAAAAGAGAQRDAAEAVRLLLARELGARDLLQHGGLGPLVAMLQPACALAVRDAGYAALEQLCVWECGRWVRQGAAWRGAHGSTRTTAGRR